MKDAVTDLVTLKDGYGVKRAVNRVNAMFQVLINKTLDEKQN